MQRMNEVNRSDNMRSYVESDRAELAMKPVLAGYAHDAWSGWMKYLFEKSNENTDGTVTIPKWAVDRWKHQVSTKYQDLSDEEKESDLREAEKMISIMHGFGFY